MSSFVSAHTHCALCKPWFKVAPYSFTIVGAEDESSSSLRVLEGKRLFFDILSRQHEHKKQNWQWLVLRSLWLNSVKIGRLVVNILLNRSWFSREVRKTSFFAAVRHKFAKIENNAFKNQFFSCLKFVSRRMHYAMRILEDFAERNSRKWRMKLWKKVKSTFVWVLIIQKQNPKF